MKRLLLLFLVIILTSPAESQVDYRIETYLDDHKIDTFVVYDFECSGDILSDSCQFDETHYLFWEQNGRYYLKRFDYCKTYKILALDTVNPLTFYLTNKKVIDKEEVKIPTYKETRKVGNKIEKMISTSHASHSCYHKFRLSRDPEYKYASTYDLDFKEFNNGKKNLYYAYNQNTRFKKLIDLTTALLKRLEGEKKFEME